MANIIGVIGIVSQLVIVLVTVQSRKTMVRNVALSCAKIM